MTKKRFYTHKIDLVERTKKLEGIICQTLSFTNRKGAIFDFNTDPFVVNSTDYETGILISPQVREIMESKYSNIYVGMDELNIFSLQEMADSIMQGWNDYIDANADTVIQTKLKSLNAISKSPADNYYSQIVYVYNGNSNTITNLSQSPQLNNLEGTLTMKYDICAQGVDMANNQQLIYYSCTYEYILVENRYPIKPNTITSAINRILDLAEPLFSNETPRFTFNPVQAEKWENTAIPDTTMTQCTLREQLQHIGNYVHAQARLGGWYNGEYQENMIFYDEYGQEEQSTLQGEPYVANVIKHSINEYCTQIDTNAQNIVNSLDYADGVITTPDSANYKTLRTESMIVRLQESNSYIETEFPIYDIVKVMCRAYKGDGTYLDIGDITQYIFEEHSYNNLTSYGGKFPTSKSFALYYTQGQEHIKGLFFKATTEVGKIFSDFLTNYAITNIINLKSKNVISGYPSWKTYVADNFPYLSFQVSYIPFYSTRYTLTKGYMIGQERVSPFAQIYNQSENVIETRFYGENIKGVAERLGNKEATRTYYLGSINKVPKTGTKLDDYYISSVVTEYIQQSIRCTVGLTEKFNRLSQNVGINSTKRVYEVSEKQAYERNVLLKEYICIGDSASLPLKPSILQQNVTSTLQIFRGVATGEAQKQILSVVKNIYETKKRNTISAVKAPLISSAFANAMVFSWQTKDNYSAGKEVEFIQNSFSNDGETLSNGFWQLDVPYCDYYGKAYFLSFQFFDKLSGQTLKDAMSVECDDTFNKNQDIGLRTLSTPYLLRKDNREALKFNLAIEYITNRQDLILGSALASCNPWVSNAKKGKHPKVYYFADKINTYDKTIVGKNPVYQTGLIEGNAEDNYIGVRVADSNTLISKNYQSWCIAYPIESNTTTVYNEDADENEPYTTTTGGEILIACNNSADYYATNDIEYEYLHIKAYSDKLKDYEID